VCLVDNQEAARGDEDGKHLVSELRIVQTLGEIRRASIDPA